MEHEEGNVPRALAMDVSRTNRRSLNGRPKLVMVDLAPADAENIQIPQTGLSFEGGQGQDAGRPGDLESHG